MSEEALLEGTLQKSYIEKKFGVKILSIIRNQKIINNPPKNQSIEQGDILTIFDSPEKILEIRNYLEMRGSGE